jgi:homoserine kinase
VSVVSLVPSWNLPTARQSLRAASGVPAELSALSGVGPTVVAMMSNQSLGNRGKVIILSIR